MLGFRNEIKFFINLGEYELLKSKISKIMNLDPNSNKDGYYTVTSHYFDNINRDSIFEKQSGVIDRKKYRVRTYNKSRKLKLERKVKRNNFIQKKSSYLKIENYYDLLKKDFNFLDLNNNNEKLFFSELKSELYNPDIVTEYKREAFVSNINNIRITFDSNLRTYINHNNDIFSNNYLTLDVIEQPLIIYEIKFDNYLPDYIRSTMQPYTNQRFAISKFVISKKYFKLNSWEDN